MPEILVLLYAVYLIGLGYLWRRWLVRTWQWSWASMSWNFGVGSIVWGYGQFLLNVLSLPVHGLWIVLWQTAVMVPPLLFGSAVDGHPGQQQTVMQSENSGLTMFFTVFIVFAVLISILQALTLPMHMWDSIVIYGFKAKILFLEQTFKTPAFKDPEVLHYSTDYPLLIPYLEAGFYRWLGHADDRVIRLLFAIYWIAWLGIVNESLASRLVRHRARILLAFVATLPLFSNMYMGQSSSGFADIPFAFYWMCFLLCPEPLMPIFAVGCVFTKSEGIPLVLIGWGLRKNFRAIYSAALLLVPWLWIRHSLPHNSAHYVRMPVWSLIVPRIKLVGHYLFREMVEFRSWGLFWPLVVLGLIWPHLPTRRESKVLLAAVALQAMVYLAVYLMYAQNLKPLVPVTLPRLLIHTIGPLVIALGWRLEEKAA
jgi:hypothetical protein